MKTINNIFKPFYEELKKYDLNKDLSLNASNNLSKILLQCLNKELTYKNKQWAREITFRLTKAYRTYGKSGFASHNVGIKGYRLNDIRPKLKKELKKHIEYSAGLIKTYAPDLKNQVNNRFIGILSNKKDNLNNIKSQLKISQSIIKKDKKVKMVLRDQTNKLISSLDQIIAKEYKAIGFIWLTMDDLAVAGNPRGHYPNISQKQEFTHGDHYHRNNMFYFYDNAWPLNKGLIDKTNKKVLFAKDLKDGLPGIPINCRCIAKNIFEILDIPNINNIVSKKGLEYIKELQNKQGIINKSQKKQLLKH